MFKCPVCFYNKMPDRPANYNICPCCGTEFENDDDVRTHAQLREDWISKGAKWFFCDPPLTWNPWRQLVEAKVMLPYTPRVEFVGTVNRKISSPTSFSSSDPNSIRVLAKAA